MTTFVQCFLHKLIIVHFALDKSCLERSFGNALSTLIVCTLGLTDRALGWAGCGEGAVFHVCGECVVCCERRVCRVFSFLDFVFFIGSVYMSNGLTDRIYRSL